jgi:type I restriction enzyme S subunit
MINDWKELTLEGVCLRITDGAHNSPPSVLNGRPMASVKDLTPYGIRLETCRLISEKDFDKLVRQGCQPMKGDVLIAKDGATALDTVCEVKRNEDVVLLSSVAILRPDPEIIDSSYLHYYLDSSATRNYLKGTFVSGAAIPRVVLKDLKRASVRVPPLPIQRRIAGILSTYDDLIENSQRRIKILEEMARALYREWFVHFRFPGQESVPRVKSALGEIPEGWEVNTVADSFEIFGGGTPSRKESEYWNCGNIQWFSPSDLTSAGTMFMDDSSDHITELGLAESSARLFPPYSVMLTSRATIGTIAINTQQACTNQGFITCIPNDRVPLYYLYQWLTANVPTFERMASGATFKEISRGVFKTIEFLLPPIDQVRQFETIVAPMAKEILALQRQIYNLRRTRDLLLPRLLSGQVDVSTLASCRPRPTPKTNL